jgi:hypothetical protein
MAVVIAAAFLVGCVVVPVSYVPTTGKVGAQSGKDCVFKLFGILPFGDEMDMLAEAADDAGNPTKDVAIIDSRQWWIIGTNHCVTVMGRE